QVILDFAFIPIRETHPETYAELVDAGIGPRIWTFLTYAFLHGGWVHVGVNCVWLAAFGSPVARRFGAVRFLAYCAICAIAGAAAHLAIFPTSAAPVVGASAAISGLMAGAARFVFEPTGPLWSLSGTGAYRQPASKLTDLIRNRRAMIFLGVWFVLNILSGFVDITNTISQPVAWDAHIGGFLVGLLFFRLFDPVPGPNI
ncbi:MAG TPA: rhomboid family intramembrane serine protease, partial [Bauldia sp.]|nr:rhomboid family intramembrane serine protease [Bauldia sp.]